MRDVDTNQPMQELEGINIRPLELDCDDLLAVYDVQKLAFGSSPPSFEAWKQHYPLHPRFAADLSFVAWYGGRPVSLVLVELMVEGEGEGESELPVVHATSNNIAADPDNKAKCPTDYAQRKAEIQATASSGYICGVATLPAFRGQGLTQTVLRHCFRAAGHVGLTTIYLGTDKHNAVAVQAYLKAGMVVTESVNRGLLTGKSFGSCT